MPLSPCTDCNNLNIATTGGNSTVTELSSTPRDMLFGVAETTLGNNTPRPPAKYSDYSSSGGSEGSSSNASRAEKSPNGQHGAREGSSGRGNGGDDDPMKDASWTDGGQEGQSNRSPDFTGTVILLNKYGWEQRLCVSYRLGLLPFCEKGSRECSRVYTTMKMDDIEIRVRQARSPQGKSVQPQLHLCQLRIGLEPTAVVLAPPHFSTDYCDQWSTRNQHPNRRYYQDLPGSVGKESLWGIKGNLGAIPSGTVEYSRKKISSRQIPSIASLIDLDHSKFQETTGAGLMWNYQFTKQLQDEDGHLQLDLHSGCSVVPRNNPPASMEASATACFDILEKVAHWGTFNGFAIGWKQCQVRLKVVVPWSDNTFCRFPRRDEGHQVGERDRHIKYCFQGHVGEKIEADRARSKESELMVEEEFIDML